MVIDYGLAKVIFDGAEEVTQRNENMSGLSFQMETKKKRFNKSTQKCWNKMS